MGYRAPISPATGTSAREIRWERTDRIAQASSRERSLKPAPEPNSSRRRIARERRKLTRRSSSVSSWRVPSSTVERGDLLKRRTCTS